MEVMSVVKEAKLMAQNKSHISHTENQVHQGWLHIRPIQWYLKYHWSIPESLEGDPNPKISLSTLKMVVPRGKCPSRSAILPSQPCFSDLYRCPKRSLRCSLKRYNSKRDWVPTRKQVVYKLPGTKGSLNRSSKGPNIMTFHLI